MPVRDSGEDRGGCYRAGETDLVPRFGTNRAREKLPEGVRGWRVALRSPRWPTGQRGAARAEQSPARKRAGEEERADSGPGCSASATRARAWERRLTRGPCWQAGERAAARAGQAAAWAVREWSAGRWLSGLVAVKRRWPSAVVGTDLCGLGQRRWWAGVERGKQRTGLGPGRGLGWWASGKGNWPGCFGFGLWVPFLFLFLFYF